MNGLKTESIRGWIAIGLVAIAGLGASMHSYYAGRAAALVLQSRVDAIEINVRSAQADIGTLTGYVTRLTTLHEK